MKIIFIYDKYTRDMKTLERLQAFWGQDLEARHQDIYVDNCGRYHNPYMETAVYLMPTYHLPRMTETAFWIGLYGSRIIHYNSEQIYPNGWDCVKLSFPNGYYLEDVLADLVWDERYASKLKNWYGSDHKIFTIGCCEAVDFRKKIQKKIPKENKGFSKIGIIGSFNILDRDVDSFKRFSKSYSIPLSDLISVRDEIESASEKMLKFVFEIKDDNRFLVKYRPHPGEKWYKTKIPPHLVSSEQDYYSFVSECDALISFNSTGLIHCHAAGIPSYRLPGEPYRAPYFENIPEFCNETGFKNSFTPDPYVRRSIIPNREQIESEFLAVFDSIKFAEPRKKMFRVKCSGRAVLRLIFWLAVRLEIFTFGGSKITAKWIRHAAD